MNVYQIGFALLTFFAIVAVLPAWMWFLGEYGSRLPTEAHFLAQLMLPALSALYLASWINPGG